ncbi:unnamed protein product [Linum tenue]|uniref:Non-specific lipid-transfer protein n=2 Tax=Linum tenue TaxID=586396 RepID=A0AAV0QLP9_9ROSI|nr:unnamed protein product [Linum tenue]
MKNLALPVLFLLSFLFVVANVSEAAGITCPTVTSKAVTCAGFATGHAPSPAPACCAGLKQLAGMVRTLDDKKAICRCLKATSKSMGVKDQFLSRIPSACKINVGFTVSVNTNCETSVIPYEKIYKIRIMFSFH